MRAHGREQVLQERLGNHIAEPYWGFLCLYLLDEIPKSAIEPARLWLSGREDRDDWSHVWRKLLEHDTGQDALFPAGIKWLKDREKHPGWPHVWCKMMGANPLDSKLPTMAPAWLERNPRHKKKGDVRLILDRLAWFTPRQRKNKK